MKTLNSDIMKATKKSMRAVKMLVNLVDKRISMGLTDLFDAQNCGIAYKEALYIVDVEMSFPKVGDFNYLLEMVYYKSKKGLISQI
jgi:hypothetical protein